MTETFSSSSARSVLGVHQMTQQLENGDTVGTIQRSGTCKMTNTTNIALQTGDRLEWDLHPDYKGVNSFVISKVYRKEVKIYDWVTENRKKKNKEKKLKYRNRRKAKAEQND